MVCYCIFKVTNNLVCQSNHPESCMRSAAGSLAHAREQRYGQEMVRGALDIEAGVLNFLPVGYTWMNL